MPDGKICKLEASQALTNHPARSGKRDADTIACLVQALLGVAFLTTGRCCADRHDRGHLAAEECELLSGLSYTKCRARDRECAACAASGGIAALANVHHNCRANEINFLEDALAQSTECSSQHSVSRLIGLDFEKQPQTLRDEEPNPPAFLQVVAPGLLWSACVTNHRSSLSFAKICMMCAMSKASRGFACVSW